MPLTVVRATNASSVHGGRLAPPPLGMAKVQEIRRGRAAFSPHKKFAIAYAETFVSLARQWLLLLATAFDQIYCSRPAISGLTGVIMESPFIKGRSPNGRDFPWRSPLRVQNTRLTSYRTQVDTPPTKKQ